MGLGEDGPVLASLGDEVIMNAVSRVDDYISRLPDWQQAVCQQVRQLVHDADPEVEETIKRSVLPYFVLQGNMCALLAAKDRVNVFIYDPAWPTRTASSTRDTATRQPGPWRSTAVRLAVPPLASMHLPSGEGLLSLAVGLGSEPSITLTPSSVIREVVPHAGPRALPSDRGPPSMH